MAQTSRFIKVRSVRLFSRIEKILKLFLCVGMVCLVASCATGGVNKGQFNLYSVGYEKSVGNYLAQEVEKENQMLNITALREYVDRIGQRLAQNVGSSPFSYHFEIIDDDEINAFALPGGYIFIHRGLLEAVDNEAELAAVLGHEMGHVEARHATERMSKIQGINFLINLVAMTAPIPYAGGLVGASIQFGELLAILKYSRNDEFEADFLGADFMTRAGYEPKAMTDFLCKIQEIHQKKPSLIGKIFMTHPVTEDRINSVEKWVDEHECLVEAEERKLTGPDFAVMTELITKD
jgi:predicted Zn-dependent protease